MSEQDRDVTEIVAREQGRLKNFIRKWIADEADAEDVFFEFVEAQRLMVPLQQATAWLYRVARNRITDRFRKRRTELRRNPFEDSPAPEAHALEEWLPSPEAGPDAAYARRLLAEALDAALGELPPEQRAVFIAHELEGLSFKELSELTGIGVNTLLSRKRYAVLHLRNRLKSLYEEQFHV